MNNCETEIRSKLFEMADQKFRDFQIKLIPTVDKNTVIGVRTPALQKLARKYKGTDTAEQFLSVLPHRYYEEYNLHALFIEQICDFDLAIVYIDRFLPYVNNWATCDMMRPKVFKKNLSKLYDKIKIWLRCADIYTVRFAIGMLMTFYLDDNFSDEYPLLVSSVRSDEYYIKMMIAWYFATALAKQYSKIIPYIENQSLDIWTHNKTIQKAIESLRINPEQKEYLRTLKIKKDK